jgi:hypothetical protein
VNTYERESVEFQPVTVTVDGTPVTTGVEIAVTTGNQRPTTWAAATVLDDQVGYLIDGLDPERVYTLWARVTDSPEVPVVRAGEFQIL